MIYDVKEKYKKVNLFTRPLPLSLSLHLKKKLNFYHVWNWASCFAYRGSLAHWRIAEIYSRPPQNGSTTMRVASKSICPQINSILLDSKKNEIVCSQGSLTVVLIGRRTRIPDSYISVPVPGSNYDPGSS